MRKALWTMVLACAPALGQVADAAAAKATEAMAKSVMAAWPTGAVGTTKSPGHWGYEEGVLLDGLAADWQQTGNPAELRYIQAAVDKYVTKDGAIRMDAAGKAFTTDEHQLDNIELGRVVLFCYRQTKEARYATAAKFLHEQLALQPRTPSGGYWHKTIYPNQMWLDGAYMAEPFRAEYAATFKEPGDFDDIARQFQLMYDHMRDPKTGLLKHGWDESKQMPWADKTTGQSPEVWARAMGWYCMALVDVLDWVPQGNPQRKVLVDLLDKTLGAVIGSEDYGDWLWWQVMDRGSKYAMHSGPIPLHDITPAATGNFEETSASCMFVYALAKAAREGLVPETFALNARNAWKSIQRKFITTNADGSVTLTGTVKAAGLGGKPYRSGTYEYYVGEARGDNDAKGVGAYLLAGSEMEQVKGK